MTMTMPVSAEGGWNSRQLSQGRQTKDFKLILGMVINFSLESSGTEQPTRKICRQFCREMEMKLTDINVKMWICILVPSLTLTHAYM